MVIENLVKSTANIFLNEVQFPARGNTKFIFIVQLTKGKQTGFCPNFRAIKPVIKNVDLRTCEQTRTADDI